MPDIVYSVIIPHRNIPALLRRCLLSIPQRDDIQIIVVDDCSDQFVAEYLALKDEFSYVCFESTSKQSGGGAARNIGLDRATGKFVLFADADDFFHDCLNHIFDDYRNSDKDLVFFNVDAVDSDTLEPAPRGLHVNEMFETARKNSRKAEFRFKFEFGEPWCKLVSRKMILKNQIRFEETKIHNDTQFSYLVGFYSRNVQLDPRVIYCNTMRSQSVSTLLSDDRVLTRMQVFAKKNRFLIQHSIPFFDPFFYWSLNFCKKNNRQDLLQLCFLVANEHGFSKINVQWRWMVRKLKKKIQRHLGKLF